MRLPKGYPNPHRPGFTRISVSLKDKTFRRLLARAKKEKKSFSDIIEDTLKCGFLCLDESDNHELEHGAQANQEEVSYG
jgi:hypothetical protein